MVVKQKCMIELSYEILARGLLTSNLADSVSTTYQQSLPRETSPEAFSYELFLTSFSLRDLIVRDQAKSFRHLKFF